MAAIRTLLVANRGEVALRVVRACKELGIRSVAVFSEADRDSLHARMADQAVCVGPAPSSASYLNMPNIISAALTSGADAVHPGYGFLAENAAFARACADSGLVFVGPSADAIERMGDKAVARSTMMAAGVPCVPGSDGIVETAEEALAFAREVGFPVLIKASAGGGGKGMRVAADESELVHNFTAAKTEAAAAFGNDEVYLEKYLSRPRHIEIQVLADTHGNAIYLYERDCSVQRRHQKLIEEAPSPALSEELRAAMGEAALKAVRAVDYVNAGTVEFLLDTDGSFFFMEMNTRVQVEHPVTEQITGVDIIKEQIRIAAGDRMTHASQDSVTLRGHAIEFRINAEDPIHNFRPHPGMVECFNPPGGFGVRVDSHVYGGYMVPPYYDSLLAKLIVWGETRDEAVARARRALDEFIVVGIPTTIPFHQFVVEEPHFVKAEVYTDYVEQHVDQAALNAFVIDGSRPEEGHDV
ncbi:acetyl-CoA carboxylase biotin carboxylase subunit [Anaerosoma tenue]|uniref:acetyl-CoA carboxylase biotin carboxylase subunit n=1 Tax=Anaerosoma tenue TaxID=2933588 RepID=UPI002260EAFB|nr:acetyl-CoA carboxylase biotin carboxylase subunit [Anaerosoma tenue]MCK8114401.1 acetyl-CoA carboxylase biotin carboxylase subunit [Anaerosoma tenue]